MFPGCEELKNSTFFVQSPGDELSTRTLICRSCKLKIEKCQIDRIELKEENTAILMHISAGFLRRVTELVVVDNMIYCEQAVA